MKKIIYFLIFLLSFNFFQVTVNAVTCHPAYKWNWKVTNNCEWPDWYKVYWDIYVWDYTITMKNNSDMWIDLNSNKITFRNWKINLYTTAKIANHVSSRYYIAISYNNNWVTSCPNWMLVFNIEWRVPKQNWSDNYINKTNKDNPWPYNYDNNNVRLVAASWTFYCGTPWVSNE